MLDFEADISPVAHAPEVDRVVGFAGAFRNSQGFYSLFSKRRSRMLRAILLAVLCDPKVKPSVHCKMRSVEAQEQTKLVDSTELSSITLGGRGRGVRN